jgi:hypothetical protein
MEGHDMLTGDDGRIAQLVWEAGHRAAGSAVPYLHEEL